VETGFGQEFVTC